MSHQCIKTKSCWFSKQENINLIHKAMNHLCMTTRHQEMKVFFNDSVKLYSAIPINTWNLDEKTNAAPLKWWSQNTNSLPSIDYRSMTWKTGKQATYIMVTFQPALISSIIDNLYHFKISTKSTSGSRLDIYIYSYIYIHTWQGLGLPLGLQRGI